MCSYIAAWLHVAWLGYYWTRVGFQIETTSFHIFRKIGSQFQPCHVCAQQNPELQTMRFTTFLLTVFWITHLVGWVNDNIAVRLRDLNAASQFFGPFSVGLGKKRLRFDYESVSSLIIKALNYCTILTEGPLPTTSRMCILLKEASGSMSFMICVSSVLVGCYNLLVGCCNITGYNRLVLVGVIIYQLVGCWL